MPGHTFNTVLSPYIAISQITSEERSLVYNKGKIVGPKIEPWETPTVTGYFCEDVPFRTTCNCICITKKRQNNVKYLTWNSIRFESVKKAIIPNPVDSLGYIKGHNPSGPRTIKSPANFITYSCQKICSWSKRPETGLGIRKKATFPEVLNKLIICKISKTNSSVVFSNRPLPCIVKYRDHRWNLLTIWKTIFLQTGIEDFS